MRFGPHGPGLHEAEVPFIATEFEVTETAEALVPTQLLDSWRSLDKTLAKVRKLSQQVSKATEQWDIRQLRQRLPELGSAIADASSVVLSAQEQLELWSPTSSTEAVAAYAAALERAARQLKLPLSGEFPEYEVFPLTVRLDLAGESATVARRKTTVLEPSALLRHVQRQHQAVHSSAFNANRFMQSLVAAHTLLKDSGKAKGHGVLLTEIYRLLTIRTGSAGYSKQEFAFDIFRLRRESDLVYEGQRLTFMHPKSGGIPVPNSQGGVEMFGTLELWGVTASE